MRIINNVSQKLKRRENRKNKTLEEYKIWVLLRKNKTDFKWKRQVSIGAYVADFYCREKQLVIELDGIQHSDHKEYDLTREQFFSSLGITTLRFWNYEINKDIGVIKKKIIETLKSLPTIEKDNLKVSDI